MKASTIAGELCGRLVSLNVGLPRDVPWKGKTVHTGIFKYPVEGARVARRVNIDGDGQGDLAGHGGEQRAVLVYQQSSYDHWRRELGRDDLDAGMFGENFTVDGLPDDDVCIGDRFRIGGAEFEVTQPRVTCFRLGMRLERPDLPSLLVSHRRPGFYLRVIQEGPVQRGDAIYRTRRGPHAMSVAAIDALLYLPDRDEDALRRSVDIPALSPGWRESFHMLLARRDDSRLGVEPTVGRELGWDGFAGLTVSSIVRETDSVASFVLVRKAGSPPAIAKPGQFITLRLLSGSGETLIRSYSVSGMPDEDSYRISVKRDGAASTFLHDRIKVGDTIDVAAPRGDFVLEPGPGPVVLLSAGIGITPVLAMLHSLSDVHFPGEIWWIHGARTISESAFAEETTTLLETLPRALSRVFLSREESPDEGRYGHGRIDESHLRELELPSSATAYICGPTAFIDGTTQALLDLGFSPERVRSEAFGALAPINPGIVGRAGRAPHPPSGTPGVGPVVTFARSSLSVAWRPTDSTILELAEECDVPTRWSCRSGVCHTCITPVVSGEFAYEPPPLERPDPGTVLVCCARPTSDLVLDL
jgi:ferredoxin-NADP reductase/MOSC domain-containing protein YiiM